MKKIEKEVFYPPVGIAHITKNLSDLLRYKLEGKNKIILNTSAQPNSSPHLGTITTLMTVFAMAQKFKKDLLTDVEIQFDELENSPWRTKIINNEKYYMSICDCYQDNKKISDINMGKFKNIFSKLMMISGINCNIRTYNEFQKNKYVRKTIFDILNKKSQFETLLNPTEKILHIRTICPICRWGRKDLNKVNINILNDTLIFNDICTEHGEYQIEITKDNDNYIDINTQLRDLTKGALIINEDKINNTLTIMVDGGDWSGVWAQRVYAEGLIKLGYDDIPIRFFSPTILDWSGAKFSKSLYLQNDAYKNQNQSFNNYDSFIEQYGDEGFYKLWKEVNSWVEDPKKFFRNYSIEYFDYIFNK